MRPISSTWPSRPASVGRAGRTTPATRIASSSATPTSTTSTATCRRRERCSRWMDLHFQDDPGDLGERRQLRDTPQLDDSRYRLTVVVPGVEASGAQRGEIAGVMHDDRDPAALDLGRRGGPLAVERAELEPPKRELLAQRRIELRPHLGWQLGRLGPGVARR